MNLERSLAEFEETGFTRFPNLLSGDLCARIRDYIDSTLASDYVVEPNRGSSKQHFRIVHPMPGDLPRLLAADEALAEIARVFLRAANLRLRQQMFMRTDPCGESPPSRPDGWHVDTAFTEEERRATPRQTYVQFFCYASDVRRGGAATMVIPGSHHATYAVSSLGSRESQSDFYTNPAQAAEVDLSKGVELEAATGDVVIFDPMMLHSGSRNTSQVPRYVYHCSYYDAGATRIPSLGRVFYDVFNPEFVVSVPPKMRSLLERPFPKHS